MNELQPGILMENKKESIIQLFHYSEGGEKVQIINKQIKNFIDDKQQDGFTLKSNEFKMEAPRIESGIYMNRDDIPHVVIMVTMERDVVIKEVRLHD